MNVNLFQMMIVYSGNFFGDLSLKELHLNKQ